MVSSPVYCTFHAFLQIASPTGPAGDRRDARETAGAALASGIYRGVGKIRQALLTAGSEVEKHQSGLGTLVLARLAGRDSQSWGPQHWPGHRAGG